MKRNWKRAAICAAIALASVVITLSLGSVRFFQLLNLKAQDAHFVLRGKLPTRDIVLIGMDEKAQNKFPEPLMFWHNYYADAIRGAAAAGAKVMILDVAFAIPVAKWEPDNDSTLAAAYAEASQKMPVISGFIPSDADQKDPAFAVPVNMLASAFGTAAMPNLTVDSDDFVRRQELIETPKAGVASGSLTRSMALRGAEKFLGVDATVRDGDVYLGDRKIPTDKERFMTINFAGPAGHLPQSFAVRLHYRRPRGQQGPAGEMGQRQSCAARTGCKHRGHAMRRLSITAFGLTNKWMTPGVEIHANSLRTLLTGDFLQPVPDWARIVALVATAGATVAVAAALAVSQTAIWSLVVLAVALIFTHVMFRAGWLLSSADMLLVFVCALIGGVIYRFATAEKKSSFFKSAVALFVGKDVARSLDRSEKIGLTGERRMVTILFSDIRGFTAFCESKDPAVIVDLLNDYMATMCRFIVAHHGHVNKFIGDGILAVFSDDDEGAEPGDHALRAVRCATEMVTAPSDVQDRHRHAFGRSRHRQRGIVRQNGVYGSRRYGQPGLAARKPQQGAQNEIANERRDA